MTWAVLIGIGWPLFWGLPFAGAALIQKVRRAGGPSAARTLEVAVIAAWLLMLALIALLSPELSSVGGPEHLESEDLYPYAR